ncbi:MAG: hypothetical protein OFPI_09270 [Osedax symbiont Rs2]|nr:MAG: hypothetical protein OFPI_09270 [Osedax symbiont Rs2]
MSDEYNIGKQIDLTGTIYAQYVYFDYLVSSVIWHLLKVNKDLGMMVTGNLDIQPKIDMALDIAIYKKELREIQTKLTLFKHSTIDSEGIFSKRNQIVQGMPSFLALDLEEVSDNVPAKRTELSLEYYEKVHDEICEINHDIVMLMQDCNISVH